eukprot:5388525-Pleurochrysis_carterae.AAC.2
MTKSSAWALFMALAVVEDAAAEAMAAAPCGCLRPCFCGARLTARREDTSKKKAGTGGGGGGGAGTHAA